jgi:LysR family transcriptional regulator, nod-box dependent transcriptional activator
MALRYKHLDLNLLVVLDALLVEKSPTRAGEKIFLSQSAVSSSLARLRDHFKDELLVPMGRHMELTPLGKSLAVPVRETLLKIQSTFDTQPEFDPRTSRSHFHIIASDYIVTVLMAEVIRRASIEAPNISMSIAAPSDLPRETMDRVNVDMLIAPDYLMSLDFPKASLYEETECCVVWEGNSSVRDTISLEQYLSLGHVVARMGATRAPAFEEWFGEKYGHVRRVETMVNNFTDMMRVLVGTQRVGTTHLKLAKELAKMLPIRILEPPFQFPPLLVSLQWHSFRDNDAASVWMRNLITQVATSI